MKRFVLFVAGVLCLAVLSAQDSGKSDDYARVGLTPVVLDDAIPTGAHKQLVNKMTQIAAKNGCAATDNSRFVITCSADVLTKDITPTAPPMHAYTLSLNFFVGDGVEGRLFSSTSMEVKGVGQTPEKAYINALKNVRVNDPAFKMLLDKGKQEIIAYYNTQCDFILAEAEAKSRQQQYSEALALLSSVPTVCEECYRKALEQGVSVYQSWRDDVCTMALTKARNAWAQRDAEAAALALNDVPVDGACRPEADALRKQISDKLSADEKREWDFKMQQYEDQIEAQQATAQQDYTPATNSIREIQAAVESRPVEPDEKKPAKKAEAKPVYQVKGKWFK